MKLAAEELSELPTGGGETSYLSVNYENKKLHDSQYNQNDVLRKFKLANIKSMLIEEGKDLIFYNADPQLVRELFGNATED